MVLQILLTGVNPDLRFLMQVPEMVFLQTSVLQAHQRYVRHPCQDLRKPGLGCVGFVELVFSFSDLGLKG